MLLIGFFILLLILSAFFSSSEIALVSTSLTRVDYLIKTKKAPKILRKLKKNEEKTVISILIGNNLVNIFASSLSTYILYSYFGENVIVIVTGILTFLILTFGEIIPKNFALRNKEIYLSKITYLLYFFYILFYPFTLFFYYLNKLLLFFNFKQMPAITEEEIESLVKLGLKEGEIEKFEKELIENVFDMTETKVNKIMIPVNNIFSLDKNLTIKSALNSIKRNKIHYARIPIFDKVKDNLIGYVLLKEIYSNFLKKNMDIKLIDLIHKGIYVLKSTNIDDVLRLMQSENTYLVFIKNKSKVIGMITLEDILEELVGEIENEKRME